MGPFRDARGSSSATQGGPDPAFEPSCFLRAGTLTPLMSTRPASFSKRREVGFRGPFGAGPNGLFPRVGEDRDATQGRLTIQEGARRLGVKEDAVRNAYTARGACPPRPQETP